jgi:hypothetical protein
MAVAVAAFPFLKSPAKIFQAAGTPSNASGENRDLLMLVLTLACFVPYAVAQVRTPSYFFGGCFFLAILIGRLLGRCFSAATASIQIFGAVVLLAILGGGVSTMVDLGRTNQIETLTMTRPDKILRMSRIPGADIDAVENHLRQDHITSVWTTVSFIYPLTFESDESLIVSGSIFGFTNRIYPQDVTWREPRPADKAAYVMEAHSPFRSDAEARCIKATGVAPRITDCGTLIVIEEQ